MVARRRQNDGRLAEFLARQWLRLKGWRVLAARARTPLGELDIIARRGSVLAFIEVKQRHDLTTAREALRRHQQRRIVRAAAFWLSRHPRLARATIRFDLIIVNRRWRMRHLPDAFQAREVLPDADIML